MLEFDYESFWGTWVMARRRCPTACFRVKRRPVAGGRREAACPAPRRARGRGLPGDAEPRGGLVPARRRPGRFARRSAASAKCRLAAIPYTRQVFACNYTLDAYSLAVAETRCHRDNDLAARAYAATRVFAVAALAVGGFVVAALAALFHRIFPPRRLDDDDGDADVYAAPYARVVDARAADVELVYHAPETDVEAADGAAAKPPVVAVAVEPAVATPAPRRRAAGGAPRPCAGRAYDGGEETKEGPVADGGALAAARGALEAVLDRVGEPEPEAAEAAEAAEASSAPALGASSAPALEASSAPEEVVPAEPEPAEPEPEQSEPSDPMPEPSEPAPEEPVPAESVPIEPPPPPEPSPNEPPPAPPPEPAPTPEAPGDWHV